MCVYHFFPAGFCFGFKWSINNWQWTLNTNIKINSSVQFSRSVVSDSLWHLELQCARPPCPSATPGVYSNSHPLSRWCHPTISSSVVPFISRLQSFPASGSFPMSQLFASSGQSIEVSASTSVLPMNIQDWFPLGWTGWSSLQSKGLSRVFSNTTIWKRQFFGAQPSLWSAWHIFVWCCLLLLGEISITSDMQMTPPLWQKVKSN